MFIDIRLLLLLLPYLLKYIKDCEFDGGIYTGSPLLKPKSVSFNLPFLSIRKLFGLISLIKINKIKIKIYG